MFPLIIRLECSVGQKKIRRAPQKWQRLATVDPEEFDRLWGGKPWERANGYGILTGVGSGLVVVDVDVKQGKDGYSALRRAEAEIGTLPPTFTVLTGVYGGVRGRHLYFAHPGGFIKSRIPLPGYEGLDLFVDGGKCVIGPGSWHPSGVLYELAPDSPDDLAVLPAEWVEYLIDLSPPPSPPPSPHHPPPQEMVGDLTSPAPDQDGILDMVVKRCREHVFEAGSLWTHSVPLIGRYFLGESRQILPPECIRATSRLIVEEAWQDGRWPKNRSAEEIAERVEGWYRAAAPTDPNRGCYQKQTVDWYEGELAYLAGIQRSDERHYVYMALKLAKLAEAKGKTHFIWPSRKVIDYMLHALGQVFKECDRQKRVERFRYLNEKYNLKSRDYCGLPLLTDMIPHRRDGRANEYRLGDDYPLKTGALIPEDELVQELGLQHLTPELLQELNIPSEPQFNCRARRAGANQ